MNKASTEVKSNPKIERILSKPWVLILKDDDVNTFDWVILCLIRICNHSNDQATQCAYIVHNNGSCDIKYGEYDELVVMKNLLIDSGLTAILSNRNI
jgi:ATP-dependent Clp protease adaptor protein ClpS